MPSPDRGRRALRALAKADATSTTRTRRGGFAIAPDALDAAIESGALELHFQPIVDVASGRCVRAEALLRWPAAGVDPREIVSLALASGRGSSLAEWVVRQASARHAAWLRAGLELPVAVNLSGAESGAELLRAVASGGARPTAFTFELPAERVIADGLGPIEELSLGGARIALDDVSPADTPTRSLAVAVDELKVSPTVVRRAVADPGSRAALRRLVRMANDLGLASVAVGVEDELTRKLVAAVGCRSAQGYAFSRPLAASDVPLWRG